MHVTSPPHADGGDVPGAHSHQPKGAPPPGQYAGDVGEYSAADTAGTPRAEDTGAQADPEARGEAAKGKGGARSEPAVERCAYVVRVVGAAAAPLEGLPTGSVAP